MGMILFNGKSIKFGTGLVTYDNGVVPPKKEYLWDTTDGTYTTRSVGTSYYGEGLTALHYCTSAVDKAVIKQSWVEIEFEHTLTKGTNYVLEIGAHSLSKGSVTVEGTTATVSNEDNCLSLSFDGGTDWIYYNSTADVERKIILETDGDSGGSITTVHATGEFTVEGGGTNKLCIGLFWDPYENYHGHIPSSYSAKARCKGLVFDYIKVKEDK